MSTSTIETKELIENDYRLLKLQTTHQEKIDCRYYYVSKDATKAVIFVGGVGGGWDSPARELYSKLAGKLVSGRISSLRIRYRHPTDLDECAIDVIAGIKFLERNRIGSVGLVGHSLGGAVVIKAAAASPNIVRTVVTLSTQSYGAAESVSKLRQKGCSILLIHGTDDHVLPSMCSSYVYNKASNPKHIILFEGASHGLDEAADEIYRSIYQWLLEHL
ncbi:MAG: alpha/beta hydrolase [Nitrososphaeraceae archaeon]